MKVTITDGNNFINMDVDSDQIVEDLKALLEAEVHLLRHRPTSLLRRSRSFFRATPYLIRIASHPGASKKTHCYTLLWVLPSGSRVLSLAALPT